MKENGFTLMGKTFTRSINQSFIHSLNKISLNENDSLNRLILIPYTQIDDVYNLSRVKKRGSEKRETNNKSNKIINISL